MRRFVSLLPAGIALATLLAFWPVVPGEFNWDDQANLVTNPHYRGLARTQLHWMFTTTLMGHYMPLTWVSLGLNYVLGGIDPWGYHLTSLLLHATNAALVYAIAKRLMVAARLGAGADPTGHPDPGVFTAGAAVAALLFALHPQRVEPVAWISDRGTVLCGTFYLLAVLAYLRACAADHPRWRWWGCVSLVAFAAALLSKGTAMSLPITLLVLDVYPLRRWRGNRLRVVVEKIPYAVLALAGAGAALAARSQGAELTDYARYGAASRVGLVGYSLWFYPFKLVWPADLSPLYEVPGHTSILEPRFLASIVAALVVTGGLILLRRRVPGALAAWVHSAAVVAPVSGAFQSGLQLVADRYSYLAQLGFVVLAGYGVVWIAELRDRDVMRPRVATMVRGVMGLIIVALGLSTWSQSHVWRDPTTLWTWAVDLDPRCASCHNNLGTALLRRARGPEDLREAERQLRQAIALGPDNAEARLNLGTVLLLLGRHDQAEEVLLAYLRLRPDGVDGAERLAVLYLIDGKTDAALPLLRRARRMGADVQPDPTSAGRSPERARAGLEDAVRLLDDGETLRYLGQALLAEGRADDAVIPLRRAVAVSPSAPSFRLWLAHAYRAAGQISQADAELQSLQRIDPVAGRATTDR
ncbi:MAG TPA: tetratricopeptide repeat protein [Methylomirabilota bacterium]|nr:tetratricopeptide repeat protein [Methylomirabilota bacterium]